MNKRKFIFNAIFLIVIFTITLYYIFHGQDLNEIMVYIRTADVKYWVLAIICVVFFIGSESTIIFYMMNSMQRKVSLVHCFLYSFVGFFFSCITPSATGGQPAQIYFMNKDKIPISLATLVLMIVTITYKMVLILIGAFVMICRPEQIMYYLNPVIGTCYLGLLLNIFTVGFMVFLVFDPTMARNVLVKAVMLLSKHHIIKRTEHYLLKIDDGVKEYKDVARYFKTHRLVVWNVFIMTFIQRLLLFFVTYLVYKSFRLSEISTITIVVLQGMISVAVDMLPLPGGMGISEKLFLMIFTPLFGSITLPAMMVSRGLSYYTELALSALFTVIAYYTIGSTYERKS